MMDPLGLLYRYASLFRKLINAKVWSGERSIKELLSLNSESDWDFLISAMDIVGDASAAIDHVMNTGSAVQQSTMILAKNTCGSMGF